jgi:peroxiredoxin
MDKDFLQTNGQYVIIDHNIMVETNSPLLTEEFIQFKWREHLLNEIARSKAPDAMDQFVAGSWALAKDYPNHINGYQNIMATMENFDYEGASAKAESLAHEFISSAAPENEKTWARGFQNRLSARNKPVHIQFTAVDGRVVNLSEMRGKVVLVDFWGTKCGPCKAELPRVKEAWTKFHDRGLEIVGISCDTDQKELEKFVKDQNIPWPQYYDGHQQTDNKFAATFGVDGIPHMFLVDKKGLLRFDNVRASNKYHAKNDTVSFEDKISALLAEPNI